VVNLGKALFIVKIEMAQLQKYKKTAELHTMKYYVRLSMILA
jgi:hypothetical protein